MPRAPTAGGGRRCALLLAAAAAALLTRAAAGAPPVTLESYVADVSIASPVQVRIGLTFSFRTNGSGFKGFNLTGEAPSYRWTRSSFSCFDDEGRSGTLDRMPRADGLVALRFEGKRPLKGTVVTCGFEGTVDPAEVDGVISLQEEKGIYVVALALPAPTLATKALAVTVHFPRALSPAQIELGDLTAEEFSHERFPSAVTLRASGVPARQGRTVELFVKRGLLDASAPAEGGEGSARAAVADIGRAVGLAGQSGAGSLLPAAVFATALLLFLLLSLKGALARGAGVERPAFLLFPRATGATRSLLTFCLLTLFAVFTLSAVFLESVLAITWAVLLNVRAAGVDDAPVPPAPFHLRRATGAFLALLLLAAGATAAAYASKTSMETSLNIGYAVIVGALHLFYPAAGAGNRRGAADEKLPHA